MKKDINKRSIPAVKVRASAVSAASKAKRERTGQSPRKPQQERGRVRVDAILDAAASLIAEKGLTGLTVQAIAQRANTSFGSMYHFFPDLDAVIAGLAERYIDFIKEAKAQLRAVDKAEWARMSTAELVDTVVTPFMVYLEANPHVETLRAAPKEGLHFLTREREVVSDSVLLFESALSFRRPRLSPQASYARAMVFVGAMIGLSTLLGRSPLHHDSAIRELKRAFVAYLDSASKRR
ncbi:MAG TPA: TetR/AcrR family transcriptional regulator [Candidatus Saccharimonadales bacterium]|nr:TetR/AcrR family transcriptional regulator [Candidatus Saccharimonadales bacterium]